MSVARNALAESHRVMRRLIRQQSTTQTQRIQVYTRPHGASGADRSDKPINSGPPDTVYLRTGETRTLSGDPSCLTSDMSRNPQVVRQFIPTPATTSVFIAENCSTILSGLSLTNSVNGSGKAVRRSLPGLPENGTGVNCQISTHRGRLPGEIGSDGLVSPPSDGFD